jgi:hypothetical protein
MVSPWHSLLGFGQNYSLEDISSTKLLEGDSGRENDKYHDQAQKRKAR